MQLQIRKYLQNTHYPDAKGPLLERFLVTWYVDSTLDVRQCLAPQFVPQHQVIFHYSTNSWKKALRCHLYEVRWKILVFDVRSIGDFHFRKLIKETLRIPLVTWKLTIQENRSCVEVFIFMKIIDFSSLK